MTNTNDTEKMSGEQLLKYAKDLSSLNQDMKKETRQLIKYAEDVSILYEDSKKKRAQLQKTHDELEEKTYALRERIKDLNCLYSISTLLENPKSSVEYILQEIVKLMHSCHLHFPGWRTP